LIATRIPARVLILTASVGEGHDLPARTLAAQLRAEDPDTDVVVSDGLAPMGRVIGALSESAPRVIFYRGQWIWDAAFWVFARFRPTRGASKFLLAAVGGRGLLRVVRAADPDIVVSTYPQTSEVLGRLRRTGRLAVPVCAAVTDLAGLEYWAARGVDVHLLTHPESAEEVRRIAGPESEIQAVHGLTRPEFAEARSPTEARRELGLPPAGKLVLVSGGGWGVGDLEGAIDTALSLVEVQQVICLCGRNEELVARLRRRYGTSPRVRLEGFTEQIGDWLAAGDALVHSTGGLTILEAHIRGCPAISYGWGRGHIRKHNAAFVRFGLADVVTSRHELAAALARALEGRKPQDLSFSELPSAASVVLAHARERVEGRRRGEEARAGQDHH
jgi:UDP-N-acetylglucosamine:LPS N-acetylglucosamine transferase